jgi:hypothetical protein
MENFQAARTLIELSNYHDDDSFSRLLREFKQILSLNSNDIARRFATTSSRVDGWFYGVNLPHPDIRNIIIDWLGNKLSFLENLDKTSLDEYKSLLEKADPEDDETFHLIINLALKLTSLLPEDFRNRFDMSVPSFTHWVNGTSAPHPLMRKHVFTFIKSKIIMSS